MPDLKRVVEIEYLLNGSKFSGPARAMQVQSAGLSSSVGGLSSMISGPLVAALGGLATGAALKGIAGIHSEFEDTKIALAGFLSALGVSKDFSQGMRDAAAAQQAIIVAAAKLPGEAEDYINVFRAGLPEVQSAIGGTLKDMYSFTNQLTAVTSSLSIDSAQVGRDVKLMLAAGQGRAGGHVKTWTSLLPFLQKLPGQADLTAKKFNAMTQAQRGMLIKQVLTGKELGAMVDEMGSTWSAQVGALVSNSKALLRLSTGPLFEGLKGAVSYMNALFFDSEGSLTEMGKTAVAIGAIVSTHLVRGFRRAFDWARQLLGVMVQVGETLMKSRGFQRITDFVGSLAGQAGAFAKTAGGFRHADAPVAGGPAIAGLIDAFSRPGVLEGVVEPLGRIFNDLTKLLAPFMALMTAVSGVLGDLVAAILPAFMGAVANLVGPLVTFMTGVFGIATMIYDQLRPALSGLWSAVAVVVSALGGLFHQYLRLVGAALLWLYRKIAVVVVPAFSLLVKAITAVVNFVGKYIGSLAESAKLNADQILGPEAEDGGPTGGLLGDILKAIDDQKSKDEAARSAEKSAARSTPGARGGAQTYQDFRGSRFDIQQKFAEGYDPDRIAVAFAQDVGRLGEQRLQSGFEPVFGVR